MSDHRDYRWMLLVIVAISMGSLRGQSTSPPTVAAPRESVARWQAMRFGLFIHWGPVALKGTEIGWSRGREVPIAQYDQLYRRFDPEKFDAGQWVATAKAAGMKYLVITSKHHDGFCLWDSQHTDYDIAATPFARDILGELSDACQEQGLMFCTYHSICDWHHPDYPLGSPGGKSVKPQPNMDRYVRYLHNQTEEIIHNYGPIGVMWFDGEWESPWTHAMGVELYRHIRGLQPDILINNRVDKGRRGMEGTTKEGDFLGDFATPEQRVGSFDRTRPWESCITIGRSWAWKPGDELKSLRQCIHTLLQVVGGDGNLLLNVGPMPDGRIEPRQTERLVQIGQWLEQYGQAVYGTRGGPFKPGRWGASTCKDNTVFLLIMQWPTGNVLTLPPLPAKVVRSRVLSRESLQVQPTDSGGLRISLDDSQTGDPIVTVIQLTTDVSAVGIDPVEVADQP